MNSPAGDAPTSTKTFAALAAGDELPPLRLTVSAAANERYWRAAGVDHPALAAGALYPPIAANLTVLCFGQLCPEPVIQTRQRLVCARVQRAGVELETTGRVVARVSKRGRDYVDIETIVRANGETVWSSLVSFTPVATLGPT
jgi:hypothetical protein